MAGGEKVESSLKTGLLTNLSVLQKHGTAPTPLELKKRYPGVAFSHMMRTLQEIKETEPNLNDFIEAIFSKADPRDLDFRYGACRCCEE